MIDKLKNAFDEMIVYKDLKKSSFLSALGLPSFLRDWLLKRFANADGVFDAEELASFVHRFLPRKEEWTAIKSRIVIEREQVKLLARISIDIDIKTGAVSFSLPDFGLMSKETMIEDHVWQDCKDELVAARETWGMVELGYRPPVGKSVQDKGKIKLVAFKSFCPYTIDLDYYKDARRDFTTEEWMDVLLGAVDYNPAGYASEEEKLTMLTRLLPFAEKKLNLIELAPKGTGKSYLFGRVSRFGWLASGGVMSRAKMFYDVARRQDGLVTNHDFVTLDEVQTITFPDVDEMRGALKSFCENGYCNIGTHRVDGDAGVILCGNIKQEVMDQDGYGNMFEELPKVFHESALIERFHGFIKGWNIPRMTEDLKVSGWAMNSEYFSTILHQLRDDLSYRAIVDEIVEVPEEADTRDTEAIKRIATAYMKLLFPHIRTAADVNVREFDRYCLRRAHKMRDTIKIQLGVLDIEYRGKDVPKLRLREI